jgi:hypothetical protein
LDVWVIFGSHRRSTPYPRVNMAGIASSSSGRVPQGEVIMDVSAAFPSQLADYRLTAQFADGGSYIKRTQTTQQRSLAY